MPPGERHKGVGFLEHPVLALMHVLGDDDVVEFDEAGLGGFAVEQEARNDAGDLAAGAQRAFGDRAHDPLGAAAIDEAKARFGERPAKYMAAFI